MGVHDWQKSPIISRLSEVALATPSLSTELKTNYLTQLCSAKKFLKSLLISFGSQENADDLGLKMLLRERM